MNLKEARILLKKINSLFDSIDYEGSKVSNIERDLMMNYLQQLNEQFAYKKPVSPQPKHPTEGPEYRTLSEQSDKRQEEPPTVEAPRPKADQDAKPITKRLITDYPPARHPEEQPKPKVFFPPKIEDQPSPLSITENQPMASSSDIDQLFEFKQASDLSEKLSAQPVNDLNRALSINDRLLYMNELFGRDMEALNLAMQELNTAGSMTMAKPKLVSLAQKYNWALEDRVEIAKSFIKLVRRRYQ